MVTSSSKWLWFCGVLVLTQGMSCCAFADSSDDGTGDGKTKTYYWQGTQLDNLSRLAGGSPEFEQEERRTQLGQSKEEYLATIRKQMALQAQAGDKNKTVMTFDGRVSPQALDIYYGGTEIHVTLHAHMLFDDNSASLRRGAVDVMDRLRKLLQERNAHPIELTIADTLEDIPHVADLDAERALLIVAWLQLPQKNAQQENLSPETLATP